VQQEQPEEVVRLIRGFLNQVALEHEVNKKHISDYWPPYRDYESYLGNEGYHEWGSKDSDNESEASEPEGNPQENT
jgi:hypothetical protein